MIELLDDEYSEVQLVTLKSLYNLLVNYTVEEI